MKRMTGTVCSLFGVKSEGYPTCHSIPEICGARNVSQVLDQHLTRPGKNQKRKMKLQNIKLDALRGLEAARKYICQFDTKNSIIVM
jgi:hypothetical protein